MNRRRRGSWIQFTPPRSSCDSPSPPVVVHETSLRSCNLICSVRCGANRLVPPRMAVFWNWNDGPVLFAGVAVASVFVLRMREPHAPRQFKALGYPYAPAIFALASLAIVGNALWTDLVRPVLLQESWGPSAAGILIIAAGVPIYWMMKDKKL